MNNKKQLSSFWSGSRVVIYLLAGLLTLGTVTSCNSKKKLAKKELAAKTEMAKARLQAILDDDGSMSIEDMESELNEVKSWNLTDETVVALISQVEKKIDDQKARILQQKIEQAKIELLALLNDNTLNLIDIQRRLAKVKAMNLQDDEINDLIKMVEEKISEMERAAKAENILQDNFDMIAQLGATNIEAANSKITKTLSLFDSPETPVLIIVAREGNIIDYDKPTTIARFLEYLKDQKENRNRVENIKKNSFGKITELELIKK